MLTMPLLQIKKASKEYLRLPYTVQVGDPEAVGDIEVAFVEGHDSQLGASPDWHTTDKQSSHARILVGPGTPIDLDEGVYSVFVKVEANPEAPIEKVGLLLVK